MQMTKLSNAMAATAAILYSGLTGISWPRTPIGALFGVNSLQGALRVQSAKNSCKA